MRNFIIIPVAILLLCLQSCVVSKHPNMAFFDNPYYDYKDAKFASVNVPMWIAKPFIKKAVMEEENSEVLLALIKKISDVKVLTIQNGEQNMLADFSSYLTKNNFQDWVTVKKDSETINFQAKQNGDVIRKLLITVKAGNDIVYVDISGKFTPEDISGLINYTEKGGAKKFVSH